jgi:hypothetical protein
MLLKQVWFRWAVCESRMKNKCCKESILKPVASNTENPRQEGINYVLDRRCKEVLQDHFQ